MHLRDVTHTGIRTFMSSPEIHTEVRRERPIVSRRRDPARPHRAVTGVDAQTRWFERIRSVLFLALLALALGILLAAVLGSVVVGLNVLLEIIAG